MQSLIPRIVDDLYAGTLDEPAWSRAMTGIADLVRAACTCLFVFSPVDGAVLRDEVYRYDPEIFSRYRKEWAAKDPRLFPSLQHGTDVAIFEAKILPIREWQQSDIFNEFLAPEGIAWFLNVWLHKAPDKVVSLSLQGTKKRGPFAESDGTALAPVIPHVRRALEIKDRLETSRMRADSLARGLDSTTFGVLILDGTGRLLEANALAVEHLRACNGIRLRADRTVSLREPAGVMLDRWIATGVPPTDNRDGLLHARRPLSLPLSIMVVALPPPRSAWISGDPRWMLMVFDPERRALASASLIAADLGISEREAELAALLAAGMEIDQVARRLGISLHTARTHLKSIYSKTGIGSRAELVRRICVGPSVLPGS